jgi:hypothetical protein
MSEGRHVAQNHLVFPLPSCKKMKILIVMLDLCLACSFVLVIGWFWILRPTFTFTNGYFKVEMDSVIRHFRINGTDVLATYKMFQTEEDYLLQWKLETPIRISWTENDETITVFTYSQLYTYDVFKTFTFYKNLPTFLVEITKAYHMDAFSDNNQIIVDVKNNGFLLGNNSFTFKSQCWTMNISVVSADPILTIQPPAPSNPTELQFNFNRKGDRDIAYHVRGTMEKAIFNVTLGITS